MISKPDEFDGLESTWKEKPELILSFIKMRPQYEQLGNEVSYILAKHLSEHHIEYSAITNRAKTLKSFCEKLSRKQYNNPLEEVTDFAGVRTVYLYKNDRHLIEKIIESEFKIIEKVDKLEAQEADKFGYGALHYLVNLGRKSSGARYDDLKGLVCEIQVRTVLQDAWAIIDHHLIYKNESEIPKILRRKINSLSGLFETADDQFFQVRTEREEYKRIIRSEIGSEGFLELEINFESLNEYLKWKFPNTEIVGEGYNLSSIISLLNEYGYKNLKDLEKLLNDTQKARKAVAEHLGLNLWATNEVVCAVVFKHENLRVKIEVKDNVREAFHNNLHLVE